MKPKMTPLKRLILISAIVVIFMILLPYYGLSVEEILNSDMNLWYIIDNCVVMLVIGIIASGDKKRFKFTGVIVSLLILLFDIFNCEISFDMFLSLLVVLLVTVILPFSLGIKFTGKMTSNDDVEKTPIAFEKEEKEIQNPVKKRLIIKKLQIITLIVILMTFVVNAASDSWGSTQVALMVLFSLGIASIGFVSAGYVRCFWPMPFVVSVIYGSAFDELSAISVVAICCNAAFFVGVCIKHVINAVSKILKNTGIYCDSCETKIKQMKPLTRLLLISLIVVIFMILLPYYVASEVFWCTSLEVALELCNDLRFIINNCIVMFVIGIIAGGDKEHFDLTGVVIAVSYSLFVSTAATFLIYERVFLFDLFVLLIYFILIINIPFSLGMGLRDLMVKLVTKTKNCNVPNVYSINEQVDEKTSNNTVEKVPVILEENNKEIQNPSDEKKTIKGKLWLIILISISLILMSIPGADSDWVSAFFMLGLYFLFVIPCMILLGCISEGHLRYFWPTPFVFGLFFNIIVGLGAEGLFMLICWNVFFYIVGAYITHVIKTVHKRIKSKPKNKNNNKQAYITASESDVEKTSIVLEKEDKEEQIGCDTKHGNEIITDTKVEKATVVLEKKKNVMKPSKRLLIIIAIIVMSTLLCGLIIMIGIRNMYGEDANSFGAMVGAFFAKSFYVAKMFLFWMVLSSFLTGCVAQGDLRHFWPTPFAISAIPIIVSLSEGFAEVVLFIFNIAFFCNAAFYFGVFVTGFVIYVVGAIVKCIKRIGKKACCVESGACDTNIVSEQEHNELPAPSDNEFVSVNEQDNSNQ